MKTMAAMAAVITLLTACGGMGAPSTRFDAAFAPGGPKIGLIQTSLWPGATNAGTNPVLELGARSISSQVAEALGRRLEGSIAFASVDGEGASAAVVSTTNGSAIASPGKDAEPPAVGDYVFALQPSSVLRADVWYDVKCPAMADVAISADDSYSLGADTVTRFFTGSAPQLRKLDMVEKTGVPARSLIVQMSEPMSLIDLFSGGLAAAAVPPLQGGCIIWNDACLETPTDSAVTSGFEYRFTSNVPERFELELALSVRGVTRDVQGAVDAQAVRGPATANDRYLRYTMDTSSWRQRRDPHIRGWSNAE